MGVNVIVPIQKGPLFSVDEMVKVTAIVLGFDDWIGRFGPNPRPDFSGDFHPASREIKQERRST